jgi:hypothetical protein
MITGQMRTGATTSGMKRAKNKEMQKRQTE